MKQWGLVFLGAACVLALSAAYLIGKTHGRGERFDIHVDGGTGEAAGRGRFWRVNLELAAGAPGEAAPEPGDASTEAFPAGRARADASRDRTPTKEAAEPEARLAALPKEEPLRRDLVSGPQLEGWYANGQLHFRGHQVRAQSGEWLREGPWEAWHENGTLHELGAYENDVEHGAWKWSYENGARMAEGQFVAGEKVGGWLFWHENGRHMMEGAYVAGKRDGRWIFHHPNGVRAAQGPYQAGQASGDWTFWLEDGTVDPTRTGSYVDGERIP